jgi:hypothetical protein
MKFWLKMIVLSVALIALGSPTLHVCRVTWIQMTGVSEAAADAEKVPSLNWEDLQQLDIRTGQMPASLKKLDGAVVRLPGYIIPLEDSEDSVSEFLLVPYPLACIHVPAPPPNLIVHVKMDKGKKVAFDFFAPVWTQGRLKIQTTKNMYTESSYSMTGLLVLPYETKKR